MPQIDANIYAIAMMISALGDYAAARYRRRARDETAAGKRRVGVITAAQSHCCVASVPSAAGSAGPFRRRSSPGHRLPGLAAWVCLGLEEVAGIGGIRGCAEVCGVWWWLMADDSLVSVLL